MAIIYKKSIRYRRHIAHLKIQSVPKNTNRPDGYKVNFVLIDFDSMQPVLLLDNHQPFGYHLHPKPHIDKDQRIELKVENPKDALHYFLKEVRKITHAE